MQRPAEDAERAVHAMSAWWLLLIIPGAMLLGVFLLWLSFVTRKDYH